MVPSATMAQTATGRSSPRAPLAAAHGASFFSFNHLARIASRTAAQWNNCVRSFLSPQSKSALYSVRRIKPVRSANHFWSACRRAVKRFTHFLEQR